MSLNVEEIEVAKFLDSLSFRWGRNNKGFPYLDLDKNRRKFFPDFYIHDLDVYLEYKGWITEKMVHKMNDAVNNNNFNLKVVFGMHKRFNSLGTNIEELMNNPDLLIENLNHLPKGV